MVDANINLNLSFYCLRLAASEFDANLVSQMLRKRSKATWAQGKTFSLPGGTQHETSSTIVHYTPESFQSQSEDNHQMLVRHCKSLVQELSH